MHQIRPCNGDTPLGKPGILFFVPHEAGALDYKVNVCENDLVVTENMCGNKPHPLGCSPLLVHLAELISMCNSNNNWMRKILRTAKIGRGRRPSPIWQSEEFFESNYFQIGQACSPVIS